MNDLNTFNEELSYTNAFCSDYESLLDQCQQALSAWSDRSEKARRDQLGGEAVGRELLSLQARFAKCYTVLQRHTRNCERCIAVSKMNKFIAESNNDDVRLSIC
jgi:hypothetical protein